MLRSLDWLALEVKHLEPALSFYTDRLDLPVVRETPGAVALGVGDTELRLRTPGPVPRGGLHTHYAFSTPADGYDRWWDRLDDEFDLVEHRFGDSRSLYCYDPDGNCVEIGEAGDGDADADGLTGIFEVVLEVEDLDRAERFYRRLGADPVDRGDDRRRVRLDLGPVDLELWEPHLGIAEARGGVHVDVGLDAGNPDGVAEAVGDLACVVEPIEGGARIRDPDGHYLSVTR